MKPTPARQALNHFLATAAIGLTLTGLSAVLPDLIARQQTLSPQTVTYAVLSLLTSGGMAAYAYVTAHQSQLVDKVTTLLGNAAAGAPTEQAAPASAPGSESQEPRA